MTQFLAQDSMGKCVFLETTLNKTEPDVNMNSGWMVTSEFSDLKSKMTAISYHWTSLTQDSTCKKTNSGLKPLN